ncbi:MAG: GAF domain-containing protein [Desulfobacteraceae bacterium]|nr:MAG: GAF domain-containing protein [Desulfobacteraceae bacterium]
MTGDDICKKLDEMSHHGEKLENLLKNAVELLHESEPAFHWTGIYELSTGEVLRLGPFIGAPTEHVFISVGKGICGSAIADRCNKNIPDVTLEENYLACSTSTKSELVILIRKGDTIFAQIDIDSHDHNAFNPQIERKVEKVAEWLADAYATVQKH